MICLYRGRRVPWDLLVAKVKAQAVAAARANGKNDWGTVIHSTNDKGKA